MSKAREYEERTEQLLQPIINANHFEIVDVEYVKEGGNNFLRAFIDKEGGITIDDCELVSRALSDLLDKEDFIPESYILEVSSPGLGRQLKKDKDFIRSIGEEIEIKLYKPVKVMDGKKEVSTKELFGVLEAYEDGKLTVGFEDDDKIELLRSDIAIVRLAIDF